MNLPPAGKNGFSVVGWAMLIVMIYYVSSTMAIWRLGLNGFWGLLAFLGFLLQREKMVAIIVFPQWIIIP